MIRIQRAAPYRYFLVLGIILVGLTNAPCQEGWTSNEAMLRKMAEYMTVKTTETTSEGKTKVVTSEFNGWHYWTLMMYEGMNRMGKVIPEPLFQRYTPDRLDYLADFFAQKGNANGPLRFYSGWKELWCTGIAHVWFERTLESTGEERKIYQDYIIRFGEFVDKTTRVDNGLLANKDTQIRTDDAYLMVPAMLRLANIEGKPERREDAITQLLGYHQRLFQPGDALYRHIWDSKNNTYADAYWGRGNGWMALAHVDVLSYLPKDHPRWNDVLKIYHDQMAGLRRYQAPEGGWRQVIDHPESWIETSCTGMFVYAMARGVNEGWLDASYATDAQKGWQALLTKVIPNGSTIDTCPGTPPGNLAHYLNRPRKEDDPHSYGPVLLAGSEIMKLAKTGEH